MMKKVLFVLVALGMFLCVSQAYAFSLSTAAGDYFGPVEFKFSDFSSGVLYDESSDGYEQSDDVEDAWGIFKVSTIKTPAAQTVWFDTKNGDELTGIFYGIDDDFWALDGSGINIQSISGHIDLYLDAAENFDPTGGPLARTGDSTYPTVTDGALFLSLDFVPGIKYGNFDNTDDHITYDVNLDGTTSPFTGDGAFYLNVTGGAYASLFDSDYYTLTDDDGGIHKVDFFGQFDSEAPGSFQWLTNSEDPVGGAAVPEPASMILMGIGLAGAARLRRRTA